MTALPAPSVRLARTAFRDGVVSTGSRAIPEETPVAIVHDGGTTAVMMATPADIEDFAVGFSLSEGIVGAADDIVSLEVLAFEAGLEARMWLREGLAERLSARRRRLAGPTGCGLCGIDSLEEAGRAPRLVAGGVPVSADDIAAAFAALQRAQTLGRETRAVHAAGFWTPREGLVACREDVGRHNALDKLVGAVSRAGRPGVDGVVVLTSRVSVEMVQKAAALGTGVIIAVSAPTALAVRTAEAAGITLVAIARDDGFEIFTHPQRVEVREDSHAA